MYYMIYIYIILSAYVAYLYPELCNFLGNNFANLLFFFRKRSFLKAHFD